MSVRVATVRATGSRYIVQRLDIPRTGPTKVHCWGEMEAYRGLESRHAASKTFLADAVDIADVPKTTTLLAALWEQAIAARRAKGDIVRVSRTGRTATVYRRQ